MNFSTASSIFNTATGVLEGKGEIQGMGALGEIIAKSYGVYDKGDRLVFKGGVRTRVEALPTSAYFTRSARDEFSIGLAGWGTGTGEPDSPLASLVATRDPARR